MLRRFIIGVTSLKQPYRLYLTRVELIGVDIRDYDYDPLGAWEQKEGEEVKKIWGVEGITPPEIGFVLDDVVKYKYGMSSQTVDEILESFIGVA